MSHKAAVNLAHDERRPFCWIAYWSDAPLAIIPYYFGNLPK
jgi:hypothetical protein